MNNGWGFITLSLLQACVDVAAYATSFSTCSVAPGVYREGTIYVYGEVAIVGAGANETILDGTLALPHSLKWTRDSNDSATVSTTSTKIGQT